MSRAMRNGNVNFTEFGRNDLALSGKAMGFATHVSSSEMPSLFHPVATIRGLIAGVGVAVQRFPRNGQSGSFLDRATTAFWPPLDLGLSLRREGKVASAMRNLFGSQDVRTGDADFDAPLRIQADEPDRVLDLVARDLQGVEAPEAAELRHRIHWFAGASDSFELHDHGIECTSYGTFGGRNWMVDLESFADIANRVRRASAALPPPIALAPWAEALRSVASLYGLAFRPCPLSAEGDLDNLPCGIFFRRLARDRFAVELGAVIGPLDRFQITMVPRRPHVDIDRFELAKPTDHRESVPTVRGVDDARFAPTFVTEAVRAQPEDVQRIIPLDVKAKMLELQASFDVEIRYGVLSLRKEITHEDPASLAAWIDLAADGARTVVKQAGAGYRD